MPEKSPIKVLTEFDAVIDVDLSMLKLVQRKYNNPKFIDPEVMSLSLHDVKERLLNRTNENPLSICIKDKELCTKIYNEIMDTQFDDMMEYASPTGVMKLMTVYNRNNGADVHILCADQKEADIVHLFDSHLDTIIKKHDEINPEDYDCYFLKSATRVFVFKGQFKSKHIFVMDYMYNMDIGPDNNLYPSIVVSQALLPYNRLGLVNVYEKKENIKHIIKK